MYLVHGRFSIDATKCSHLLGLLLLMFKIASNLEDIKNQLAVERYYIRKGSSLSVTLRLIVSALLGRLGEEQCLPWVAKN